MCEGGRGGEGVSLRKQLFFFHFWFSTMMLVSESVYQPEPGPPGLTALRPLLKMQ